MNKITTLYNFTRQILLVFFMLNFQFVYAQNTEDSKKHLDFLSSANRLKFVNTDSSVLLFKLSYDQSMKQSDTLNAIRSLVGLSDLYAHKADFSQAYDGYWEALLLADQLDHNESRASIYFGLGYLYSFYKRTDKAEAYFNKSIAIRKGIKYSPGQTNQALLDSYYALVIHYRKEREIRKSKQYIDSCRLVQVGTSLPFVDSEIAYLMHYEGENEKALQKLLNLVDYFSENNNTYLVILNSFIGEVYKALKEYDSSERYFKSAIQISNNYNSHLDLLPEIYLNLADLYSKMENHKLAYENLQKSKELDEFYFGSRNESNKHFLEIKDDFRIEKERQNDFIREQRLEQLERENKISYLQSVILIGTVFFLVLSGFLLYRYLRTRYKAEKKLMRQQQELELQKTKEVLEVKNKELTTSALQVIEREEMLSDLKTRLNEQKNNPNTSEIHKLVKSIDLNTANNWKEFETRFISVNKSFYKRLRKKFPDLNQSDERLCALVKLNFSSKDMSRLLGISVESVHTTRYRLRKKLGLDKNANLSDFIGKL